MTNSSANGIPKVPLALGLAGLVPFWGLAIALSVQGQLGYQRAAVDLALTTYAAVIISFLGGIRWGLASAAAEADAVDFGLSIVPPLVAWALHMLHEPWRLLSLGLVALALGPIDTGLVRGGQAPPWLGRLRLILSSGAGVALFLGAFSSR